MGLRRSGKSGGWRLLERLPTNRLQNGWGGRLGTDTSGWGGTDPQCQTGRGFDGLQVTLGEPPLRVRACSMTPVAVQTGADPWEACRSPHKGHRAPHTSLLPLKRRPWPLFGH